MSEEEFYNKFKPHGVPEKEFKEKYPLLFEGVEAAFKANSYTNQNGIIIHYYGPSNEIRCWHPESKFSHTFNRHDLQWPNREYTGPMFHFMDLKELMAHSLKSNQS